MARPAWVVAKVSVTRKQAANAQAILDERMNKGDVFEVKLPGHNTLRDGALCTFKGFGEQDFVFRSARVVDGVCLWLQVVGGKKDRGKHWRYFAPEKLTAVRNRRKEENE